MSITIPVVSASGTKSTVALADPVINAGSVGLVGWYRCLGNANDSSGRGNNGTVTAATLTVDRNGNPDSAYHFDGTSSVINLSQVSGLPVYSDVEAYSVAMWVRGEADQADRRIYAEGCSTSQGQLFTLGTGAATSSDKLQLLVRTSANVIVKGARTSGVVFDGTWHHVAFTVDAIGNAKLFIDGRQDDTDFNYTPTALGLLNRSAIGAVIRGSVTNQFAGDVSDVRLYQRALTAAEVAALAGVEPEPVIALPALWNASPPAGQCPAPIGPVVGTPGQFDVGVLATNELWDHFDGPAGSNPDSRLWKEDTINQGGEQTYNASQSFLDGEGNAVLEAVVNPDGSWTSGRFTSRNKFNMQYGWCAARAKFPSGTGFFPAFWLLFVGISDTSKPYGEIDIMEFFGPATKYSTHLHMVRPTSLESNKAVPRDHSGGDAGGGFHTYWMDWQPDSITIGVDDLIMGKWGPESVANPDDWRGMRQPMYYILNFAVHPPYLPVPSPSQFPARYLIDWVWYKPSQPLDDF